MLYSIVTTRGLQPPATMLSNTHRSTESMSIDTKSGSLGTPYFSNSDTTLTFAVGESVAGFANDEAWQLRVTLKSPNVFGSTFFFHLGYVVQN